MNIVVLGGNLSKDPNLGKLKNGTSVLNCTVAVNRDYKSKDGNYQADFIDFTCFGATAEFLNKVTHKGSFVIIKGSWQTRKYTNKDNQEVSVNEVIADSVQVPPTPKAEDEEAKPKKQPKTPQEIYQEEQNKFLDSLEENERKEIDVISDDLPF